MKDGTVRGGIPFRRGALFWLLSNPVYIGKTRHKGKLSDGEHAAIVDQKLFDAVQAKLAAHASCPRPINAPQSGITSSSETSRHSVSLLTGMIFDERGRPMSPCHTRNHGRRYRYYASNLATDAATPAQRLPGGELDAAIRLATVLFLKDSFELRQIGRHLDVTQLGTLLSGCAEFAQKIETASIAEQRKTLLMFDVRVTVTRDRASLTLSAKALLALHQLPISGDGEIILNLPVSQARFGHEPRLRHDPPSGPTVIRDENLVHLIARAFAARDKLITMAADELAALTITTHRHLERIARLAYLDPAIVRAILAGTQPRQMSARDLWRMASLPLLWSDQRAALHFNAA